MDNLTHSLVGIAAAKAGLERLSPSAGVLCLIAANAPDADIVAAFIGDRWTYLQHHRGITHSIIGTLIIALALPLVFVLVDRVNARVRRKKPSTRLKGLVLASLIVCASHPLMDYTNNYGIRPLLPWNQQWFYGDLVFIVDPYIWFVIGGAAFLLTSKTKKQLAIWILLAAVISYIVFFAVGPRPGIDGLAWIRILWALEVVTLVVLFNLNLAQRWGNRIGIAAFVILIAYWGVLALIHRQALARAHAQGSSLAQSYGESVLDVAAMPTLANPFHWQAVVETDRAAYRFEVPLLLSHVADAEARLIRHPRPDALFSPTVDEALETRQARVFLEFARFPVVRVSGEDCTSQTLVQLADLRYTEPGSQRGTFAFSIPVECQTNSRQTMP
jgi:inner membrane protein